MRFPLRAVVTLALLFVLRPVWAAAPLRELIKDNLEFAAAQYTQMLAQLERQPGLPRTWENGQLVVTKFDNWTSGFFPGSLWYLFEGTGDTRWREAAERYTALVEPAKDLKRTHDLGFMLYCSFGNGLRLTNDPRYRAVLLTGAASLATRFNPTVGAIRSWDHGTWQYPVIIDNMMNLELLTWAANAGKEPRFRAIALAHADTTLRNHFRPDASSFHVVDYDVTTGKVRGRGTHQGFADDSSWARGQAWGLYGYTMMYRETKRPEYLAQAVRIADFFLNHPRLPADKIPYWDFDAPDIPRAPRDVSAAAITCSALLELARYVEPGPAATYKAAALEQLRAMSSPAYRAPLGGNGCFLLMHATGHKPKNSEIDVPLAYADYYFLEALLRAKALE